MNTFISLLFQFWISLLSYLFASLELQNQLQLTPLMRLISSHLIKSIILLQNIFTKIQCIFNCIELLYKLFFSAKGCFLYFPVPKIIFCLNMQHKDLEFKLILIFINSKIYSINKAKMFHTYIILIEPLQKGFLDL